MKHHFFEWIDCDEVKSNPKILFDIVNPFFTETFASLTGITYIRPRFMEQENKVEDTNADCIYIDEEFVLASKSSERILEWSLEFFRNNLEFGQMYLIYGDLKNTMGRRNDGLYLGAPFMCGESSIRVDVENYDWITELWDEFDGLWWSLRPVDVNKVLKISVSIQPRWLMLKNQQLISYKSKVRLTRISS